jgi:hypothetical protein
MTDQERDPGITAIRARPDRRCYGMGLGVILLDDVYPGFPGDVRNASGYPFPIQYEIAVGVDIRRLVFACFQAEVAASVCVPVFMSSLQHDNALRFMRYPCTSPTASPADSSCSSAPAISAPAYRWRS